MKVFNNNFLKRFFKASLFSKSITVLLLGILLLAARCHREPKNNRQDEAEILIETHWLAGTNKNVFIPQSEKEMLNSDALVIPYQVRQKDYTLEQQSRRELRKNCQEIVNPPQIQQGSIPKNSNVFVQMRLTSSPSSSIHTFKDTLKVFAKKYCADGVSILRATQTPGQHHFNEMWAKAWSAEEQD